MHEKASPILTGNIMTLVASKFSLPKEKSRYRCAATRALRIQKQSPP